MPQRSSGDFSDLIDKLGAASLDARAAVREVHEALRDARQVIKELQAVTAEARTAAHDAVDADVEALVVTALEELGVETERAMAASVAKVTREFDKLSELYLGKGVNGLTLEEMVLQARDVRRRADHVLADGRDIPVVRCRACNEDLSAATDAANAGRRPEPGDLSMCAYCGCPSVYAEDGTLRSPTPVELREFMSDQNVRRWMAQVAAAGPPPKGIGNGHIGR